jgi:hypothetical protein
VTKVVVITDRRVLDRQLQDTIYQFDHVHGVVVRIDESSAQLAAALTGEQARVIITTLQKFPFVTEKIESLPDRRYAVIVDEAHSSQTGESATALKAVLGAKHGDAGEPDPAEPTDPAEDALAAAVAARGKQPNLSFFAFTATPKARTLELFGRDNADMQADVLAAHLPFVHGRSKVIHQEHCDIVDLLGPDRESTHLEYKATLRTHADSGEMFKPLETASLKTIVAFMNSKEGGTLLIGVADDGSIHGLESDYASRTKPEQDPRDWFQQHLANVVATAMGDAAATNVRPQIHHVGGHDICRVQVDPSGFPVDAKVIYQKPNQPKETRTEFFVRVANGTKALDIVQREKYIAQRWPGANAA